MFDSVMKPWMLNSALRDETNFIRVKVNNPAQ